MARIIPFEEVARSRRRDRTRRETEQCAQIIEASLNVALNRFASGPPDERPVRARKIRQLAELLEYVVAGPHAQAETEKAKVEG